MKKLIIFITITHSVFLFSQTKKNNYYEDDINNNLQEITESQYLKSKNNLKYPLTYETDSIRSFVLIKIETTGKLNDSELTYFKKNYNLDKNRFTIIIYVDNDPRSTPPNHQASWDVFEDDCIEKINRNGHFWVINPNVKNLYFYYGNKINWLKDTDNYIKENFLFLSGLNGGYIILDSNGNYFIQRGEYSKKDLLDNLKKLKRTSFNP